MRWLERLQRGRQLQESPQHTHPQLRRRIAELETQTGALQEAYDARLADLEEGLDEQIRLSDRIAELTDMVAELVAAAAQTDDAAFAEVLDRYSASL